VPKIVDHEQRRRELAAAAVRVMARGGIESASTRAVADEAGWSTGVLKHYFDSKDDLLRHVLRELERRNRERFERSRGADDGFGAIVDAVTSMVGSDLDETRVWLAFVAKASADPGTAPAMRRAIAVWDGRWAELVRCGQTDGSIRMDVDPDRAGAEIHALVHGLSSRTVFAKRTAHGDVVVPLLLDALRPDVRGGRARAAGARA
jgi:AcrR family transcriptional regulator